MTPHSEKTPYLPGGVRHPARGAFTEPAEGRGGLTNPTSLPRITRTLHDARALLTTRFAVRQEARAMPRGLPGGAILGVPGAYDDPRRQ